ncbi:MAG TPA: hypothetical protein PLB89_01850 [Flavobacteriales bacterium]|nr:hypothetical protein [Flavobacteriales bacterium]
MTNASFHTIAFLFTGLILALGYVSFGFWTALIFTSGFLTGFILWMDTPFRPSFQRIRTPYWLALGFFAIHRVEEKVMGFFARLAEITHVPTPEITSAPIIALVLLSVGGWLAVPILVRRRNPLGHYLAWTFFSAMGITELAHFSFPFFTKEPYGYFPGMGSVIVLAPLGWWGMHCLSTPDRNPETVRAAATTGTKH